MTTTAPTTPPTADSADRATKRAVIVPGTLWDAFQSWCRYQRVTMYQLAQSAPGQMPRYEAFVGGTAPRSASTPRSRRLPANALTEREIEVLQLMSEGLTNGEIGEKLFLSEDTVKTHARRLYRKIGIGERGGAVGWGFRNGVLH